MRESERSKRARREGDRRGALLPSREGVHAGDLAGEAYAHGRGGVGQDRREVITVSTVSQGRELGLRAAKDRVVGAPLRVGAKGHLRARATDWALEVPRG